MTGLVRICRKLVSVLALFCCISCAKEENSVQIQEIPNDASAEVSFVTAVSDDLSSTKTTYDATNHLALWKREDMAGVIASYGSGLFTDSRMQTFSITERISSGSEFLSSATFTGSLTDKGSQTYTYYVIYPYTAFQRASAISDISALSSRLDERQYPDLKSWDGACDILASKPVTVSSASVASDNLLVQFTRLFGMLRLRFSASVTDTYGSETVETVSIESSDLSDKLAGKFTIDLSSTTAPDPVMDVSSDSTFNKVILDYRGKCASLSDIDAYFVLNPGKYADVTITVQTADHILTFQRNNLKVTRGNVASATINWKAADAATASNPLLPKNPDSLRVLTFGHSYVLDCMEYIDDLLNADGVKNLTFANLFISNGSLQDYWKHCNSDGNTKEGTDRIKYYKRYSDGSKVITSSDQSKTVIDALGDEKWDVLVFQTSMQDQGHYDRFGSVLSDIIQYTKDSCQVLNGKTPLIAWHAYWPMGSQYDDWRFDSYDRDQEQNYSAILQAAKEVMRNEDIELVIPTGTAIQSLRHSSLNNDQDLTRDGHHLDNGVGRYTAACTWYEFFLKPCFGISVYGNSFIPVHYSRVKVTDENQEILQRAALLACQSPFELSHLDPISSALDVTGSAENFTERREDENEPFTLEDNLEW